MKIIVISDTHGEVDRIIHAIKDREKIDLIIHLGDYTKDAEEIQTRTGLDLIGVKGNCDIMDLTTDEDKILEIMGKKLFLTHGHKYRVKGSLNRLYYRARELNVDAALFGHTHVPLSERDDKVLLFNPGSTTQSRGKYGSTYGILTIEETIETAIIKIE